MMGDGNWDGGDALWMIGMMVVFWGGLILAIVYGVRMFSRPRESGSETRSAMTILEERFARGEIDLNEFEERKRALENRSGDLISTG